MVRFVDDHEVEAPGPAPETLRLRQGRHARDLNRRVRFSASGSDFAVLDVRERERRFRLFNDLLTMTEHKHALSALRCARENVRENYRLAAAGRNWKQHAAGAIGIGAANAVTASI